MAPMGHVRVHPSVCNMTALLHGYVKIMSEVKSKRLYTENQSLIAIDDT